MEEEKKKEEELAKAAKKKKKEGLLSFLYQQSGKTEKGGMEFSLANLFKCMCFTHEDESDPKKQLVKIAASMEEVSNRISRIERKDLTLILDTIQMPFDIEVLNLKMTMTLSDNIGVSGGGGGGGGLGFLGFRRRSSTGGQRRGTRGSIMGLGAPLREEEVITQDTR